MRLQDFVADVQAALGALPSSIATEGNTLSTAVAGFNASHSDVNLSASQARASLSAELQILARVKAWLTAVEASAVPAARATAATAVDHAVATVRGKVRFEGTSPADTAAVVAGFPDAEYVTWLQTHSTVQAAKAVHARLSGFTTAGLLSEVTRLIARRTAQLSAIPPTNGPAVVSI